MGHGRVSQWRWQAKADAAVTVETKPGPRRFEEEIENAMKRDIRLFDRAKRHRWGAKAIYGAFGEAIPRSLIEEVIAERSDGRRRPPRAKGRRYEFVAPQVVNSVDFIHVRPRGRVIRMQDDCSRYCLGFEHRDRWPQEKAVEFSEAVFRRHGASYFLKYDRGGEFRGEAFQAMLKARKIIPVPSHPAYPQYNGKNERSNGEIRRWIAPLERDRKRKPTVARVYEEIRQCTLDQNLCRKKYILEGRTPKEAFTQIPRLQLDRDSLYSEWERLCEHVLSRREPRPESREQALLAAQRIAALVVLEKYRLVRYPKPEAAKVST
jgi:transposase InsO family protein